MRRNVADEATAALDSIKITSGATERQPVLVAVRGAGGGKSRAVEELVAELNKRALPASMGDHVADPGVLGIAITFNHTWSEFFWPARDTLVDQRNHMAIEMASRVMSVLYNESLDDVQKAMQEHASIFRKAPSADVVRGVLAHAARCVGDARGRPVTRLVLCIDEAKKGVAGVFGDSAVSKKEALDNLSCVYLPATILPIITSANVDGIGEDVVDCGVYVTSLVTLLKPSTGRSIVLRELSDVKPADVSDSWMEDDRVHQSWKVADLKTTAVRELLATIAAPLPRLLEYITVELRTAERAPTDGDARARSRGIIDSVLGKVREQYNAELPPVSLLFDAVYQNAVDELHEDTRTAVEDSVFTNRFPSPQDSRKGWMVPEPCLVMMLAAVPKTHASTSARAATCVIGRAQAVFEGVTAVDLGEPLEHLMYEALALRIAAAADAGKKHVGLDALFNVVGHTTIDSPTPTLDLEKLGLGGYGYEAICEEHGIDTFEDLALFSEADLRDIGFKTTHAKRLLKALSVPMWQNALQATLDVKSTELVLHYDPSSEAHVVEGKKGEKKEDRLPTSGRGHQRRHGQSESEFTSEVAKLQQAFFEHIGELDVSNKIHIVRSAAFEAFDIAIISSHGVTLIDAKSGQPVQPSVDTEAQGLREERENVKEVDIDKEKRRKEESGKRKEKRAKYFFRQAAYVANVLVPAAQAYLDSDHCEDPHGTVKKFAAGDSDFVYLQAGARSDSSSRLHTPDIAYGGDSNFTIKPRSVDGVVDTADRPFTPRVYLVCEGPVKGMLGMYYPYYQVMRALWFNAMASKKI